MAAEFGRPFGAEELCRCLGYSHDLGKANPAFQRYLQECANGGRPSKKVPHAAAGAALLKANPLAAMAVLGHHAGLGSPTTFKERMADVDLAAVAAAKAFDEKTASCPRVAPEHLEDPLAAEIFLRMAFSALVDADFLDTEGHFDDSRSSLRGTNLDLKVYRDRLRSYVDTKTAEAAPTAVNQTRADVLRDCRAAAEKAPGAFRLTVPAGGGKTLSGLSFALEHACKHELRRVIVAIPYTSIIDQTADVYSDVFGDDAPILEHHSAVLGAQDDQEDQGEAELRRKLGAENWDASVIVTTTVQLFESLFSNRPSSCRKLHRIAKSVIVLDEVQTLPTELLSATLDMLQRLVRDFGCTVVFCTATQPNYSQLGAPLLSSATDIVRRPEQHFQTLRRVVFAREPDPLDDDGLALKIAGHGQALCVLNTRRDAIRVVRALSQEQPFHLSTYLVAVHRRRVLGEVRRRLAIGKNCLLVSTQVVEAGVDVDFPAVYRVLGPLDRIVQAAGRCNREGSQPVGTCTIFELLGGGQPSGSYATGTSLASTLVRERLDKLTDPSTFDEYFADLFQRTGLDPKGIQDLRRRLDYPEVKRLYRFIPQDTVTVIVRRLVESEQPGLLRALDTGVELRKLAGRLQAFAVSLPQREFEQRRKEGLIDTHASGAFLWNGDYDDTLGIGGGMSYDPEDLMG